MEFIDNMSKSKWERITSSSDNAYFFHTPMWADVLERIYGYKNATRLYTIDGMEILVPLMKVRKHGFYMYTIPMGYGGLFSESEMSPDIVENTLKDLRHNMDARSICCMIEFPPLFDKRLHTNPYMISTDNSFNYTHILPLQGGFEEVWEHKFTRKSKKQVRKAEKSGVKVFRANKPYHLNAYYRIYLDSVDRWGADECHPLNLYAEILKHEEYAKLWLAYIGDTVIAGLLTIEYGKNIIGFGNASLSKFWKYGPNDLLYKHVIEYASEKGFEYIDFGQSGNLIGVRKFKESFGAEAVSLNKYIILSPLGKFVNTLFKKY